MSKYTTKDTYRFWSKVNKDGSIPAHCPELGQCWEWTAGCNACGYGKFSYKNNPYLSHRVSWEIHNEYIPHSLFVLHKCDNPACVNPDHLFLGKQLENMRDKKMKNRHKSNPLKGENNPSCKLSDETIAEMKLTFSRGGISKAGVGRLFGTSASNAKGIINGTRRKG